MMTKAQLTKIKNRLNKATPGPWKIGEGGEEIMEIEIVAPEGDARVDMDEWEGFITVYGMHGEDAGFDVAKANAAFVAASYADITALIAEVERLRGWSEESKGSEK